MTATQDLWRILRDLEHKSIPGADREALRPAFAALHGAPAIALPDELIRRIRELANQ
jgi:hypothetical protein